MITINRKAIAATGTTTENEPIIKSDGAGEVMQWQPSDGGADGVFVTETSGVAGLQLGIGATPTNIDDYSTALEVKAGSASQGAAIYVGNSADENSMRLSSWNGDAYIAVRAAKSLNFSTNTAADGSSDLTISSAGVVNIANLSASSDVQTDGSKNLITSSDKRLKNDLGELTAGLDIVGNLEPHYFSWKSDESNTRQLGFYAQDVYDFLPEAAPREQKQNLVTPAVEAVAATLYVEGDELPEGKAVGDEKTPAVEAVEAVYEPVTNEDGTPDYNWGFNGRPIIAALVAAVKELKAKVTALENA